MDQLDFELRESAPKIGILNDEVHEESELSVEDRQQHQSREPQSTYDHSKFKVKKGVILLAVLLPGTVIQP